MSGLTDITRQHHAAPCPDCGQKHLNGEHIVFRVPVQEGGDRIAWEGCADCWVRRTDPADHDVAVAAKAWSEAVAAVAWAMDRGPDPLRYVAEANPYEREAGESDADA